MYANNVFIAFSVLDQIEPSACELVKADNRNWTYPQLGMALGKQEAEFLEWNDAL